MELSLLGAKVLESESSSIQAVTLYRTIATVAQYYFRFRQGALSTFSLFRV